VDPTVPKALATAWTARRTIAANDVASLDGRRPASSVAMTVPIPAERLEAMFNDGAEVAVVDVREAAAYRSGHLLLSTSIPLSEIEARAPLLLPSRNVRIVLVDDDGALADRAAALLSLNGYTQLHVLMGGVAAWRNAGHELFGGASVTALAFAAFVERYCATPAIEFEQYREWRRQGRDVLLVEAAESSEAASLGLAGSVGCPAAEMLLRVPALLRSPSTVVVVTSPHEALAILGAQSLRDAGLPNPVCSLKGDPRRWAADLPQETGIVRPAPEPGGGNLLRARRLAHNLAERYGVVIVDGKRPPGSVKPSDGTEYVIDVRLPHQFASGHRRGSINMPGALLVNQLEQSIAVRQARVVLVDHHEVQAVVTAHWLRQMGIADVRVMRGGLEGRLDTWRARGGAQRIASGGAPAAGAESPAGQPFTGADGERSDLPRSPGDSAAAALRLLARVERDPFLRFSIQPVAPRQLDR
jgi:rhodanese-related sulfurtransferase